MIRKKLIEAGVKNLHEFGYQGCNPKNILTDRVYKEFFISMLKDNKGHGKSVDTEIDAILSEIEGKP